MSRLGRRELFFSVDGQEYSNQCTNVVIGQRARSAGQTTFKGSGTDPSSDDREWYVSGTFIQQTGTTALLDVLWSHAGEKLDVIVMPAYGAAVGVDTPSYAGTATIAYTDGTVIGGDASVADYFTAAFEWVFDAKPVMDVTP